LLKPITFHFTVRVSTYPTRGLPSLLAPAEASRDLPVSFGSHVHERRPSGFRIISSVQSYYYSKRKRECV